MNPDLYQELVRQINSLQKQVDGLVKPEFSWSLISDTTVGVAVASITISNIPANFRHLMIFAECRSDTAAESDVLLLRFNGDAGANYDIQALSVNNATLTGVVVRANTSIGIGVTEAANSRASNASPVIFWVSLYNDTTTEKWTIGLSAAFGNVSADADLFENFRSARWRNTSAISSLTVLMNSGGNLVGGSRIQVYGMG